VSRERKLQAGREDPKAGAAAVLDVDGLAEAELRGDPLALLLWDPPAVQEDPERIAPFAVLVDEDAEDVELGHASILCW
jgi:hypothetical protein